MAAETPPDETPQGTRALILRVALREFAARGYHATSVREIAEQVGVTKAAVLYHFPGKADILGALAEPMLNALEAAVAAADMAEPADARWAAIEGLLEVWLTHRYLLRMNLHDLALAAPGPVFERFRDGMVRANVLVAGPDPDFASQVIAAQAIAMLADPVVLFADSPTDALRAGVLRGVHRLLDADGAPSGTASAPRGPVRAAQSGSASTGAAPHGATPVGAAGGGTRRPARVRNGRPSVMSADMAETARGMHEAGRTAAEIATALGVSRATVYRHLPAGEHW